MFYYRKRIRRKSCCKIICLVGLIFIIVHIYIIKYAINIDVEPKINLCKLTKHRYNETLKYIFNLEYWRDFMGNNRIFKDNQTLWCDIPRELQSISNAICQQYKKENCIRLPCQLVYSSYSQSKDLKCTRNGRHWRQNLNSSDQNQEDFTCRIGYSLDLFMKKSQTSTYPSIIADAFAPLSNDLYINVLNNQFRSCDSIWGFRFNFESISFFPWAGDRKQLEIFDVKFGYDRSMFDYIPAPWLFNYVEHIKLTPKRLSIETVMKKKKPIHSIRTSDIYWTSNPKFVKQTSKSNMSYVTAPILWINSNCHTKSKRTELMHVLTHYINVDNYGTCGGNILPLPEHIVKIQGSKKESLKERGNYKWEEGKLALSSEYLFTIAIENSRSYDYVTEKLWHPLLTGSVPIYLGAPNIEDWLPCQPNCIIDLSKFQTLRDAAIYIKTVAKNKTLYETYHQWRNEPVSQKFQNMLNYFKRINEYSMECIMCDMSRRVNQGEDQKEINKNIMKMIGRF